MIKVHVLDTQEEKKPLSSTSAFWYPVSLNRRLLSDLGIRVDFFPDIAPALTECDVLLLSSRCRRFKGIRKGDNGPPLETLSVLREKSKRIIWFDQRDSSGNTQFEVLPFVDSYLKKQLLKDRALYRTHLYGNRVYTDYFHRQDRIVDEYEQSITVLPAGAEDKLGLSWNIGLTDFRSGGPVQIIKQRLRDTVEQAFTIDHHLPWTSSQSRRDVNLVALFSVKYARRTISHQRRLALALLHSLDGCGVVAGSDKLPYREFTRLLARTKLTLSLFGWGEICYREFEAFIAGSAVLMPDLTHLETWPEFHVPLVTYWPLKWDLSDLLDAYHHLLSDEKARLELASRGQDTYRQMWSRVGRELFCHRLTSIIQTPSRSAATD